MSQRHEASFLFDWQVGLNIGNVTTSIWTLLDGVVRHIMASISLWQHHGASPCSSPFSDNSPTIERTRFGVVTDLRNELEVIA